MKLLKFALCFSMLSLPISVSSISKVKSLETIPIVNDSEPTFIPDDVVTEDMIRVGNSILDGSTARPTMDGEVWTMTSHKTVVPYGAIKAAYEDMLPPGKEKDVKSSWKIEAGASIKYKSSTFKLGASVGGSTKRTCWGPSSSAKLADKKAATHRAFFSAGYGRLVKYDYKVTSKYTGSFIRNVTRYMYSDVSTVECSQLIRVDGAVYAENIKGTRVRKASTISVYKNQFSKTGSSCLYYYKF